MRDELECPCCGDIGAVPDAAGLFHDGQTLLCGCVGIVSCDAESDPGINADECGCEGWGKTGDEGPWPAVWDTISGVYRAGRGLTLPDEADSVPVHPEVEAKTLDTAMLLRLVLRLRVAHESGGGARRRSGGGLMRWFTVEGGGDWYSCARDGKFLHARCSRCGKRVKAKLKDVQRFWDRPELVLAEGPPEWMRFAAEHDDVCPKRAS